MCYRTLEVIDILKILWKRGEIAPYHSIELMDVELDLITIDNSMIL